MAEPIIVEGPDGQEYEFPAGTSQETMKRALQKRYGPPKSAVVTNQNILPGMGGGQIGVPVVRPVYEGAPYDERERRLAAQAARASREQADAGRKAREAPIAERATVAGREATLSAMQKIPVWAQSLGGGPELAGRLAYEQEYARGDEQGPMISPPMAMEQQGLNAAYMGIPGIVDAQTRQLLARSQEDQPGASAVGQFGGYLAPGAGVEIGLRGLSNAFVAPLVTNFGPRGGTMLERGVRALGRATGLAGSGAAQSGVYQATVGESLAAAEEDRAPSLAGAAEGFVEGSTDPFAILAMPALMGANRFLTFIRSGGATATPANIATQVDEATGRLLNPRRAIGQTLDMDVTGPDVRPQAMDRIVRELQSAGLSIEDIGRLMESVQERISSLPEAQASRLTFGQALAEATARDRPQALPTILATLRERRTSGRQGDTSAGIISGVTKDLERSQTDFLLNSIARNIGNTSLPEVSEQIRNAKRQISQKYENVLAQADPNRPEARGIAMIVAGDKSKGVLARRAANAGFESVDAYIAAMPDAAGHWLRSALSRAARNAPEGREKIELQNTVSQLDELLETNEGYRQARMQWGHEEGLKDAQDWATNFTNTARDEGAVADLLAELNRMPEAQRNVAMSSLRNEILKSVRGTPEDAALRLSKWMSSGALDALEQLGEGGQALADDLRFLGREQRWLFKVDPETLSPTAVRMLAAQTAQQAGNAPISNMLTGTGQPGSFAQDVAISAMAGQPVPIMTAQRALRGLSDVIFRPRTETLQDVARLYMSRRGNIPTPTERPDFTPLFQRGAAPNAFTGGGPEGSTGGSGPTGPQGPSSGPAPSGGGVAVMPEANPFAGAQAAPQATENAFTSPYFGRQSMRSAVERGPSERVLAMQADWQPVQEGMGQASVSASQAGDLAQQATMLRGAERQAASEQAAQAMQAVRAQIADIQAQRAGTTTPEDQRLQDIIDLLEPTNDPVLLQTQATMVQQNLARINQAIGLAEVPRPMPPAPSAARRLGFQPTVRDETAVAGPRPVAGRYAGAGDDTTPQGFAGISPNAFVEAGIGSVGGSVAGQQYDITGDGVIDERDMQAGALMGMAGVPLAARMMRGGGSGMRGMGYTGEASATTSNLDVLGFSSIALEAARALPDRAMRPEEAINRILKSRGVEGTTGKVKDEVEFLGLKNAFSGRERVTKQEIIKYIQENRFKLGMLEFQKNSPSGLRVGDKYDLDDNPDIVRREFVLTLPENVAGGEYVGAHTNIKGDLINILASDRVDDFGQKTLFIRQLQSDLAQKERNSIKVKMEKGELVPPLTKKTSQWTAAGVQAMLMRAAKEGYDSISFPTASTSEIIQGNADAASFYETNVKSALEKAARAHNGKVRKGRVGYDLETDVDEGGWGIQFDDDTNSWMAINELGTEFKDGFGSRKEAREWLDRMGSTEEGGAEVYIIDITPEMKKSLEEKGFPLFAGLPFAVGGAGLGMGAMQSEERPNAFVQ